MSKAVKKPWVSERWPADAEPYDHIRSLQGVAEILEEYIQTRWEVGGHLGLEVLSKTIRQAAGALDERFNISERVCQGDSACLVTPVKTTEQEEGDANG
jgi:hypothetical protein